MAVKTLDEIKDIAQTHKVTPSERRAQRVSLIMGLRSEKSTLTRDEVSGLLDSLEGHERTHLSAMNDPNPG
jgi:hypothetical protein